MSQRGGAGLLVALNSLVADNPEEYFLDYLAVTATCPGPTGDGSEDWAQTMAGQAARRAADAFHSLDVPFTAPDDFQAEMYRPAPVMRCVRRAIGRRDEEVRAREERRRAREVSRDSKRVKHEGGVRKAAHRRLEKEAIARWAEERREMRGRGVTDEAALPTLESAKEGLIRERAARRRSKNKRYSGRKSYGTPRSELKRNTGKSTRKGDGYVHKQFKGVVRRPGA